MTIQAAPPSRASGHQPDDDAGVPTARWCRATGVQDLGGAQGSGLREPRYLIRRQDGQVVQLSPLLYRVVREVSPDRDAEQVAESVSQAFGRTLSTDGLVHVLRTKLEPLGLVDAAGAPARSDMLGRVADPVLALRMRHTLLGRRATILLADVLAVLFRPLIVAIALADVVLLDLVTFGRGSLRGALGQVLATPAFLLALIGLLSAGALVHELGHAAACRYGGARPGVIGVGVYLFFPAFFTDVTDSYRLDRAGRVRTDLGGLYFNVWCLIGLDAVYLVTGNGLLLLTALLMHIEMAQQLVPTVRFDGYFVLADLAGVPDLFSRVRPVLLSLLPGRTPDPLVTELRPAARRVVTVWVAIVVPTLLVAAVWLLWTLPYLAGRTWDSLQLQGELLTRGWHHGDPAAVGLAALSMVLLLVPVLGLAALLQRLAVAALGRLAGLAGLTSPASRGRRDRRGGSAPVTATRPSERQNDPMNDLMHEPMSDLMHGSMSDLMHDLMPVSDRVPSATAAGAEPELPDPDEGSGLPPLDLAHDLPHDGPVGLPADSPRANTPPSELSAAAFTDAAVRPARRPMPSAGWRRALYRATAGTVNPGLSAEERRREVELARVTAPITGSRRVVVMSRKGGVGKTTITLALGSMFAMLRGDRVVALDANPDAGNLAHRVSVPSERTITDVLRCIDLISSYSGLREFTSQSPESRLEVLASDNDPRIGLALNRRAYSRVIQLLDLYYNLILLDTGTGILDSANQGLLSEADQLVLVLRPALDGARAAALTLDWLAEHGYGELVARAVVVVNGHRTNTGVALETITDHFARRCARVVIVPWDRALEAGAQTTLAELRPATRAAFVELAAAVADHFVSQNLSDPATR